MPKATDKTFILLYANALKGILSNPHLCPVRTDTGDSFGQEADQLATLAFTVAERALAKLEAEEKTEGV